MMAPTRAQKLPAVITLLQGMQVPVLPPLQELSTSDFRALCVHYEVDNLPARILAQQRPELYEQLRAKFYTRHPPPAPPTPPPRTPTPPPQNEQPPPPQQEEPAQPAQDDQNKHNSRQRPRRRRPRDIGVNIRISGKFKTDYNGVCNIDLKPQRVRRHYSPAVDADEQNDAGANVDGHAGAEASAAPRSPTPPSPQQQPAQPAQASQKRKRHTPKDIGIAVVIGGTYKSNFDGECHIDIRPKRLRRHYSYQPEDANGGQANDDQHDDSDASVNADWQAVAEAVAAAEVNEDYADSNDDRSVAAPSG